MTACRTHAGTFSSGARQVRTASAVRRRYTTGGGHSDSSQPGHGDDYAMSTSVEDTLCQHLARVSTAAVPASAMAAARRELLWAIGTAIGGAGADGSRELRDYVCSQGGNPQSTILGFGDQVPAALAGFANGVYAKALEYEDKVWIGNTHGYGVGMAVVPAALAVAEKYGPTTGDDLLGAIAVATDVEARLLLAVEDSAYDVGGWNFTYLFAVFGAIAAVAKLLRLDADTTQSAFGLAFAQAAGNYQGNLEGVFGVRLQGGFAVRNAIMAGELAQRNLAGVRNFLTGKFGLFRVFFDQVDVNLPLVTEDLGATYLGERLGFKRYPCGLVVHPALDALRAIPDSYSPSQVERVRLFGGDWLRVMAEPIETRRSPTSFVEAQFSAPWTAACVMIDGDLELRHCTPTMLARPEYRRLAGVVDVDIEKGRDRCYAEVELDGGQILRSPEVRVARGHPDNPMSDEEIGKAVRDCASFGATAGAADGAKRLPELLLGSDEVPSAGEIVAVVRGEGARGVTR
jgi:2-methylcitrate dehydratase PrpD